MAEMKDMSHRKYDYVKSYFILTRDRMFKKADKNYGSSSTSASTKFMSLLKGEILIRDVKAAVNASHGLIRLHSYDKPAYFADCPFGDVKQIDEEAANLLLPISTMGDRFRLFDNRSLRTGKKMAVNSKVYVKVKATSGGTLGELRAIIRYKGPLPREIGTWFGVELLEGTGRGTTNGIYRAERFFKCPTDCGLFVSLDKLRSDNQTEAKNENKTDTKEINGADGSNNGSVFTKVRKFAEGVSNFVLGEQSQEEKSIEKQDIKNNTEHKPDDRVWVYINDQLYGGYIKYIGRIPGGTETLAGIKLDHAVGLGDGNYHGKQLFRCGMNHAHFTPIETLISQKKLQELYGQPEAVNMPVVKKDDPPLVPQTSQDILNMESRFANQSEDQIRKEQENILKKIQGQKVAERKNLEDDQSGVEQTHDEHWMMKNENQLKPNNCVSHATIEVNNHIKDPGPLLTKPRQTSSISNTRNLEIGSMVEVLSKHQAPKYGVIRWIGFIPDNNKKIAGLELEEELTACTDGTFLGKRYFTCPNRRGFFVHLHNCLPDSRFRGNSLESSENKRLTGTEFGRYDSPIIDQHKFIPPPERLEIYLKQEARGIQGHHNSCYLDATLFAAFAFSSVIDSILLRPRNKDDIDDYEKVQTVLRNNIVYPLRSCGFVRADRVLELRQLLDRLGTVTGLVGEEKDPEEFLTTLLQQVLKTEPFLKIKSGREVSTAYCYQVLADKDAERVLPSVEELLKKSFHQTDVKLTELPSCLMVQMPRFGKGFKMYHRILPSLTINIGELVENCPQDCAVCGKLAKFHCRECFTVIGSQDVDSSGNFCKDCKDRVHSHVKRNKHEVIPIAVPRLAGESYGDRPVEHREMELFAVICIETSHYVTFAKCEEPDGTVRWCFFDSMADRVGAQNGYNVPSVTECPEVIEWLSSEKQNRERIINTDDKEMPDKVRRILGDAYVCLYASKEMAMYK